MGKRIPEQNNAGFRSADRCLEASGKSMEETLRCLRELSTALHSTLNIEHILDHAVKEAMTIVGAENGQVALCCADAVSSYRYFKAGLPAQLNNGWTQVAGIPGRVIVKSQPYLSNDAPNDPQIEQGRAAANGVRSAVNVPLTDTKGEMIGYLELQNKINPSGFTGFDLELLTMVAQTAAQAISNAKAIRKIAQDSAELEQRVAERTGQLQEINEELDTFAFSISHDLRAPLRAIQSFAELLAENQGKGHDPERGEFLQRIIAAARDMDSLIQDILDYSRVSRQEILLHTVDLEQVVREAVEQLDLAGEGKPYQLELANDLPRARGDHSVLVQVVLNLLSNGVKYVAEGVVPELRIWAEQANGKVKLFVQDNGIGIAPEHQERIFKVFERLHGVETYPGTGVGLAIARRAVTRLGGRIAVQSRLGEGSRFWIELPAGGDRVNG
jgi:signal transduction histidine kinase